MYDYSYANSISKKLSSRIDDLFKAVNIFDGDSIQIYVLASNIIENAIISYINCKNICVTQGLFYYDIITKKEVINELSSINIDLAFVHYLRKERNKQHSSYESVNDPLSIDGIMKRLFEVIVLIYNNMFEKMHVAIPSKDELNELCGKYKTISKEEINNLSLELSKLKDKFDMEMNQASINAKNNLKNAIEKKYPSKDEIRLCATNYLQIEPDNFMARFYLLCVDGSSLAINEFINKINTYDNAEFVPQLLDFMIYKYDLKKSNIIPLRNLIENTLDGKEKSIYNEKLELKAKEIDEGIYIVNYPRDVFVAYSSKDYEKVFEIVDFLESNGVSCFVALRNLPTTIGAMENYQSNIEMAIKSCKVFLFLSSRNSRDRECDVISKEIPYLRDHPEINRIEFELEKYDYNCSLISRKIIESAFENLQRCISKDDLLDRLSINLTAKHYYCPNCNNEINFNAKYCSFCGINLTGEKTNVELIDLSTNFVNKVSYKTKDYSDNDEKIFQFYINKVEKELSSSNFNQASETIDEAMLLRKDDARIYVFKLLIKNKLKSIENLARLAEPLDDDGDYFKAITYANNDLKNKLIKYNNTICTNKYNNLTQEYKRILIIKSLDDRYKECASFVKKYMNFDYEKSLTMVENINDIINKLTNKYNTFVSEYKRLYEAIPQKDNVDELAKKTLEFCNKYKNYNYSDSLKCINKIIDKQKEISYCQFIFECDSFIERIKKGQCKEEYIKDFLKKYENYDYKDSRKKYEKIIDEIKHYKAAKETYEIFIKEYKEVLNLNVSNEEIKNFIKKYKDYKYNDSKTKYSQVVDIYDLKNKKTTPKTKKKSDRVIIREETMTIEGLEVKLIYSRIRERVQCTIDCARLHYKVTTPKFKSIEPAKQLAIQGFLTSKKLKKRQEYFNSLKGKKKK